MAAKFEAPRQALPIYTARDVLIKQFRSNGSVIVVGETGSGKTTQIPQYLYESGFAHKGVIGITQPRRVAAVSIATRVANEQGVTLGQEVGYSVRFDDCCTPVTKIKYQTDGMLLREAMLDPLLSRYSVIILDEAHERTVHTDVLFGIVKKAQNERKKKPPGRQKTATQLKLIIMSATLDASSYSLYFNNAKVLYVQGRQYNVDILYTVTPQRDYLHSAITTVLQIHGEEREEEGEKEGERGGGKNNRESLGDILVFLTGQEEIETASRILKQCCSLFPSNWKDLLVLTLFASLPSHKQQRVFKPAPPNCRKVILATNIAETSLTLPGVKYVIDTGMVKARGYNPLIGLDLLLVQPISKAQARQRSGRAGRERPGICYRLYTEDSFHQLQEATIPEIQRCNLSSVLLQLLAMGITDILSFDFMDPPSEESLVSALEQLVLLKAVHKETTLQLTPLGHKMSVFPLEPHLSRALIASEELKCASDVVCLVAMLSVESVLYTPTDERDKAYSVRMKFFSDEGDHVMMLKIHGGFKSSKDKKSWCADNYIHYRNMLTVLDVKKQLRDLCQHNSIPLESLMDGEVLLKALLYGYFVNVAEHVGEGKYQTVSSHQEVYIHPGSCLFSVRPHPPCVMYTDLVHTSKCYMRMVSVIDSQWLYDTAPDYFKRTLVA